MSKNYSFKVIEEKWQEKWQREDSFKTIKDNIHNKYYVLEMFPYPSGKIHMGHVRNYAIGDVIARYKRCKGFNVLHPMGWDAFGLPAENAARENNLHPMAWTYANIKEMKTQLKRLGFSIDWDKELVTCSPDYYKHEQAMFIEFFKHGLAYKKKSWVNWDPKENTVLANEQVVDGRGWRSGALVEQKQLSQWFLKITDFASELQEDLSLLKDWPEKVIHMQYNWIGKSEGMAIHFLIKNTDQYAYLVDTGDNESSHFSLNTHNTKISGYYDICLKVYSSRPETLFGCSFVALSIKHPLSIVLAKENKDLDIFIKQVQSLGTVEESIAKEEKLGFDTGLIAINPINGTEVKLYVANYVLDYGTSAIFGCPAHDELDFAFAQKYNLPVKFVIATEDTSKPLADITEDSTFINSDFLNGLNLTEAKVKIISTLENQSFGNKEISYRLRDWGVSRQRYWGCPIPIIYCKKCGTLPEKLENLPVTLPEDIDFNTFGNPLVNHPKWKYVRCYQCEGEAIRETDTFDTFFESSWYFFRYASMGSPNALNAEDINYWLPIDQYIGGIEHAVMHLLYARFFTKALRRVGLISRDLKEPIKSLMTQGMVCHKTYKTEKGKWVYPSDVYYEGTNAFYKQDNNVEKIIIGRSEKMSKSKKNTVDPVHICDVYGADTARLFVLSDSPPIRDLEWTDEGVEGIYKFLGRLWRFVTDFEQAGFVIGKDFNKDTITTEDKLIYAYIQKAIFNIEENINEYHYNKAIALNRELLNFLENQKNHNNKSLLKYGMLTLVQMLSPFIPHICEELWSILGKDTFVSGSAWPVCDETFLNEENIKIAVQISGKMRGTLEIHKNITEEEILFEVKKVQTINKYLKDVQIKKVIYVKGRILNIII